MVDQRHPAARQVLFPNQRRPEAIRIPDGGLEASVRSHFRDCASHSRLTAMRWFRKLRLRIQSLFDRSRAETDLEDELRDYLEREMELAIAGGSSPEEARRHALS